MSNSKANPNDANNSRGSKRNLPSWITSRENEKGSCGKKSMGDGEDEKSYECETPNKSGEQLVRTTSKQAENSGKSTASSLESKSFSKLLEGVVFVLSGFVNPERSMLRSHALEMGAEYKPDWNSDCTLLVCAFPNTPKFRQVEADCGTIVSKDWILECYTQKKLIDIESYLMHVGKPWRRVDKLQEVDEGQKSSLPNKSPKHIERGSPSTSSTSTKLKGNKIDPFKKCFSASEMKKWAIEDLNRTIEWLESQEEKPDQDEIVKIAAGGILTCLQDVTSSLKEKQDICKATEEWNFIPRVVEELAKFDVSGNNTASVSKEDLYKQAVECKRIYEAELDNLDDKRRKKSRGNKEQTNRNGRTKAKSAGAPEYDSDETVEMTEEEIDLAYKNLASTSCKS
ncbi:DNA-repair protein XRCC1 [Prosopis cineraria]|uniref:DNA-repair protein XRCC1 n=1 Tax=Prosopis cineraria TaxID=364024 RepID=UPI00240EE4C4|nr:DNA-repair protein XRCC1 [Prosopis cineraria]XP_054782500.1 DNA-repair protein XRCC1 [Prosopis cineraria]